MNEETKKRQSRGLLTCSFIKTMRYSKGVDLTPHGLIESFDKLVTDGRRQQRQHPQISANWEVDPDLKFCDMSKIFNDPVDKHVVQDNGGGSSHGSNYDATNYGSSFGGDNHGSSFGGRFRGRELKKPTLWERIRKNIPCCGSRLESSDQ